jgi:hypothetical protein
MSESMKYPSRCPHARLTRTRLRGERRGTLVSVSLSLSLSQSLSLSLSIYLTLDVDAPRHTHTDIDNTISESSVSFDQSSGYADPDVFERRAARGVDAPRLATRTVVAAWPRTVMTSVMTHTVMARVSMDAHGDDKCHDTHGDGTCQHGWAR